MQDQQTSPQGNVQHRKFVRTFVTVCIFALACAASLWGATAPVLTSVMPNPLSVGNIQVTIKDKGFQAGTMVYDQYGKMPLIQATPDDVSVGTTPCRLMKVTSLRSMPSGSSLADSTGVLVLSL